MINQDVSSIGAVVVAPSNANVVWVGTGEAYQARSSNSGDGIYRSVDAGRSFTHMGLRDSHHIAKILVHPANPDVVYVAAMGHLWTPNQERGAFKTSDGGRTWKKLEGLPRTGKIGRIALDISQKNPDILYAIVENANPRPNTGRAIGGEVFLRCSTRLCIFLTSNRERRAASRPGATTGSTAIVSRARRTDPMPSSSGTT